MTIILEQFPRIKHVPDREIGIEVECEGRNFGNEEAAIPLWAITRDGSLRGESREFVLRNPVKRQDTEKALSNLKKFFKEQGTVLAESDRCGVHIHINIQSLTVEQAINFIILYLLFEEVLVHYCGEQREGNLFCLRAKDAEFIIPALREARKRGSLQGLQDDQFRYASINVSALKKYGTLEFRAMKTPKDVMVIQEWIDLLLCVKDYAVDVKDPRDIVEAFSRNGEYNFLREVFKKNVKHLEFRGVEQMMRDGVRMVQEIAYARPPKKSDLKYDQLVKGNQVRRAPLDAADPDAFRQAVGRREVGDDDLQPFPAAAPARDRAGLAGYVAPARWGRLEPMQNAFHHNEYRLTDRGEIFSVGVTKDGVEVTARDFLVRGNTIDEIRDAIANHPEWPADVTQLRLWQQEYYTDEDRNVGKRWLRWDMKKVDIYVHNRYPAQEPLDPPRQNLDALFLAYVDDWKRAHPGQRPDLGALYRNFQLGVPIGNPPPAIPIEDEEFRDVRDMGFGELENELDRVAIRLEELHGNPEQNAQAIEILDQRFGALDDEIARRERDEEDEEEEEPDPDWIEEGP